MKITSTSTMLAYGASLLALACASGTASAQSTTTDGDAQAEEVSRQDDGAAGGVGEIIVTAQKRAERLNDVPLSITAASGDQLAQAGITDTSQLTKIVPGFTFQPGPYGSPVFGLRGISFFDSSALAQPAVSVYVDQIPLPLSILTRAASLDIERVEVLKGPQGTLFGDNATGGAVNYIAARPTDTFSIGGDLSFGRFAEAQANLFVSGPVSETVSVRVAARSELRGNWQRSITRDDATGQRSFHAGRVLVDFQPSEGLRFELNLNGWIDQSETQAFQFVAFAPQDRTPPFFQPPANFLSAFPSNPTDNRQADWDASFDRARDDRFYQAALRAEWDVADNATITSLSSYLRYEGAAPTDSDGTPYMNIQNTQTTDIKIFSQELRASIDIGRANVLFGGYYKYENLAERNFADFNATNSLLGGVFFVDQLRSINLQKVNTYAAFGGATVPITEQLTLQGSARYTTQDRTFRGCTADGGNGNFARAISIQSTMLSGSPTVIAPGECFTLNPATQKPAGLFGRDLDQDNFSWRAGLDFKPSRDLLLYANVTKGYKAGGFPTLPAAVTPQLNAVTQESVLAYEAGFKATLADNSIQLNGAGFYYEYTDKQILGFVRVLPFGDLQTLINVPEARIKGIELSLNWRPVAALTISAGGTYLDSEVTSSYATQDPFSAPIDIRGERLPNTPEFQGNVDAEYRFPVSSGFDAFAGGSVSYRTASYAAFGRNREFALPEYALIDLRAGVQASDGSWRVEAFGRNITDKYYWSNVVRNTDHVSRYAGMPATYGIRLSFRH